MGERTGNDGRMEIPRDRSIFFRADLKNTHGSMPQVCFKGEKNPLSKQYTFSTHLVNPYTPTSKRNQTPETHDIPR